jgi:hypothetical protein
VNLQTVLNIVQRANYQLNQPAPATLVGNATASALQNLHLFYSVCELIRTRKYWPQLKIVAEITLEANREFYPLPQDLYAFIPGTYWDKTNRWQLLGPLWDSQYSYRQYGYVTSENRRGFQPAFGPDFNPNTLGGQFRVNPIPTVAGGVITYNYITSNYLFPANWTPSTPTAMNSYRNANGRIYQCIFGGTTSTIPPNHTSGTAADGTAIWSPPYRPSYETALADTDLCLFDPSLVINGLKAFWKDEKAGDSSINRQEFEQEIDIAFSRFNPVGMISLNGSGLELSGLNPNIGDGNFGS